MIETITQEQILKAVEPIGSKVWILPIEDPDERHGLILPDSGKQKADQGIVIFTGPNVHDVKVGDYVLFAGYSNGYHIALEGVGTFIVVKELYIEAKLVGESVPIFPITTLNKFFDRARGELKITGIDEVSLDRVIERLRSFFNDHFESEGLRF